MADIILWIFKECVIPTIITLIIFVIERRKGITLDVFLLNRGVLIRHHYTSTRNFICVMIELPKEGRNERVSEV